ncbi:D-amino-acid transaminase [Rhodospirillum centenum]|uniref:Probable branched-chain-amino-acid aminotransferase n=1 Tax=Rhodospirillum centenum (strain ATCC 51521 / SW) TaxID=414684 RepID=B6IQ46_RHOCS|nr:D-amino-acid transaminase [Rhodospirillum centenum]ACI97582.1 D-alanine aminotransferase, putative [Rhodospirillum centenum SW]
MPRFAYVNGRYLPHDDAAVHIEDRGFQFADGVYEVVTIVGGRFADLEGHLARLDRSLRELRMPWPVKPTSLRLIMRELAARNGVRDGMVYVQVTRGVAPRDFRFPADTAPTLVLTCRRSRFQTARQLAEGVSVITIPDIRWLRRDIKTVGLLAQSLGKQKAAEAGAYEAWQVDPDGTVTEGCSSNAWIVTAEGTLVTRPASNLILNGITRLSLLRIARDLGIPVEERPFTVAEAHAAREALMSSAGSFALPVTRIDGKPVGEGRPGPLTLRLRAAYLADVGAPDPVGRV